MKEMFARSVKTERATPSRHCKGARVNGLTTTAMHGIEYTPPPPPPRALFPSLSDSSPSERKKYRVSVLSLLYQGRGGELERAAKLSGVGGGVGMGLVGGDGAVSREAFGSGGVELDGRLPSRKELGQLVRLRFADVVEVNVCLGFIAVLVCFRFRFLFVFVFVFLFVFAMFAVFVLFVSVVVVVNARLL